MQTVTLLKNDFKKEESRNIDREIALEKKIKQLDNIVYKRDQLAQTIHMLTKPQIFYDHTTKQALVIPNFEETLMLAEESRSKMLLKKHDLMVLEKKVNTTPVDYDVLNQLSQDLSPSCRPTKVEVPKELSKVSKEKDLVITAIKNELRKLKGKDLVDNVITKHPIAPEMLKVDVEPIALKLLNNRTAHSYYLKHTQEQATILREVVEQGKSQNPLNNPLDSASTQDELRKLKGKDLADNVVTKHTIALEMLKIDEQAVILRKEIEQGKSQNPLNNSLDFACKYTKRIQELLIIINQTYPSINNSNDKLVAVTPKNKDKRVRFTQPVTSLGNTKTTSSSNLVSNKPVLSSIGVRPSTSASGSQPSSNTKKDKIQRPPSSNLKNKVEAHPRTVKSSLKNKNSVVEPKGTANVQHSKLNANSILLCVKCNGCLLYDNYDLCALDFINNVNARAKSKSVKKSSKRKVWKPTGKVVQIVLWFLDSGCSKHMTGDRSQLTNFVNKFLGTVKFGNDHVAKILGYGDYQIGNVTISRVYYMEGLGHNLFSVEKFCDSNLKVAFRQHTCFIRNLEGVDLLTGSRGNNLYTLSLKYMMASFLICLLSKASKTKS
ncbi:hypothetical protein Tco_0268249 [Tanacetum coccineum]